MILLDKLAYSSPIRQKSPALKTLFAAGSLTICVSFRHSLVCLLILCCMAVCTLRFANLSAKRYLRFLTGPFLFLMLSSAAILFLLFLFPARSDFYSLLFWLPWYQPYVLFPLVSTDDCCFFQHILPVFSHPDHSYHRPAHCFEKTALSMAVA